MKHYLFYPFELPFTKSINRLELSSYGRTSLLFIFLFFSTLIANSQTCKVTDYLYLNDVTKNNSGDGVGFVHKMRLNANISATEIYSSGTNPWFPSGGVLKTPHGLGQDLNGNLYIGQTGEGPIAKIKCDGTLVNGNFINDGGFNIISKDGFLFVNSNDGQRINRYALCDGSAQGYITLGGDYTYGTATLKDWGLDIAADGTFYASAGFNFTDRDKNTFLYRFKPTNADFTNHTTYTANKSTGVGGTLKSGTGTNGISDRNEVWGITHDLDGNMYLVVRDWADPSDTETWILKFDSNFNLVGSMVEETSSPTGGIEGARGIVYYAPWDRLLIAGGPDGDCIAKVRPSDMTYVGALAENEPNQTPKTLRIASEACPLSASLTVDTTLCNVEAGDKVFLQNIIGKCNAPICGGTWTANSGNAGITFNECDLSFTVTNVAIGCGKFVLQNVGGTCGDFTITVNVDFANVTAPVIAGDQTVCADSENPAAFTITTPAAGSNTIKYQWQKSTVSCTDGFGDIAGANTDSYDPDAVSQTTYYRVITTVDGSCTTPHGSCTDTSNCVTVTTKVCVPTCTPPSPSGQGTTICAGTTSTISATGCDATYALKWYSDAALTTEITTGVSGNNLTTSALTATTDYYAACVKDATCKSAGTKITVTVVPKPTISGSPNVTQATCNTAGTAANNDASISITGITNGSSYTVDGGASQTLSGTAILLENLPNPVTSKVYTIKIFNAAATDCFLEVTATLEPKVCTPTCTPPSPSGQGTTICAGTTSTISATGCDATYALKWYSDAALTTEITTGLSGNNLITSALTATTDYYAACVKDATCKSAGTKITVTVVPKPTISGSPNVTQATCNTAGTAANNDAKIEITGISNGSSYTVDGGASQTLSGTAILLENLPNPAASKVYTIKIFNAAATDCFLEVTATLEPKVCTPTCTPPSPSGQGTTICAGTTSTISATGCDATYALKWYSDAALTTEITTGISGNNLTTSALTATTDYYAACVKDATCKSAGTKITVTVVPKPTVSGSPNVTQATCNTAGTAANNDASISITGITNGTNYSVDGGATQTLTGGAISLTGLANPAASKTYTIKIWNTDPTCFIEVTAKLDPKVCTPTPKGSLGDFVWKDTNNNGIQDETTPNGGGVAGVIIELYKGTVLVGKDTTDATGKYLFTNLDAGTYKIKVIGSSIPAGCEISSVKDAPSDDAKDSDVDKTTGESGNYIIDPTDPTKKDILTVDAALYSPCIKPNAGNDQTLACGTTAPTTFNLVDALAGQKWKVLSVQPNTTVSVTTPAGLVTGMTAPGQYRFVLQTQSDSLDCRDTVSITVPDCNCPQVNILTPNATVCKDSLFPTLRITLLGSNTQGAGAAWYANATGGTPLQTGLSFKPTGVASITDTFYVALTGASANCLALPRTPVIVTVQNCTEEVDLALKKSINTKIAQIGDVLIYTLKVWNESGTNATGVEVTDSIATTVQFQTGSFTASRGSASISGNVIKWTIGNIAAAGVPANGDTVTLTYRIKATQEGVHFNTAEICKTNEKDVDSTPCNHNDDEDDIDRQCFTVPFKLCPGEKVEVNVPAKYTNVQWFKDGGSTAIGSGNMLLINEIGTYTFTATNNTCPAGGCCPIIIETGTNCCPEELCVPFTIKKTKKAGNKI